MLKKYPVYVKKYIYQTPRLEADSNNLTQPLQLPTQLQMYNRAVPTSSPLLFINITTENFNP